MSWSQRQEQSNVLVTAQMLEERINMYISAMDGATAINNGHQSSQLQQDIQTLVDLMEKISAGHVVTEQEVPPPLLIGSQTDVLANPLGELSSRLAEYHKALYFAEEELSEDRINKIQRLQRGLQTIHELQKRAQSGFPVRVDEIPPTVAIPSDDEFDPDAINTLASRLEAYNVTLSAASQSESYRRRIPKLQSAIRTAEFLLTRAKAKRPVWKKDIPPEFEYCVIDLAQSGSPPKNKVTVTLKLRSLQKRVQDLIFREKDKQKHVDELKKKLQHIEAELSGKQAPADIDSQLTTLTKEIVNLENMAFSEKAKTINSGKENLDLIEVRINEYKSAALACKRGGQVDHAIQHFKIVKGLLALKEALAKGEPVDMTLVPPPPREFTPTSESHPSVAEISQGIVPAETPHTSSGATAQLTPVIIKPAVESAEDKLAKKLFSYLDKGADFNLSTSKQMLNIHNISVSAAQSLQKVQNTEGRNEHLPNASIYSDASSNIDTETDSATINNEKYQTDVRAASLMEYDEQTSVPVISSHLGGIDAENTYNGVSENDSFTMTDNNEQDKKSNENEDHFQDHTKEEITSSNPSSSPLKSADIYSRKTLDNVGFLSCQVVPEHSAQLKAAVVSKDPVTLASSDTPSEPDTLEAQNISGAGITNVDLLELPSYDLIQPDPQPTTAVNTSPLTSDTQSKALPGEQSNSTEIIYPTHDTRNGYNSSAPLRPTMPIHNSDIYSSLIDDQLSSLPVTLKPSVFDVNVSSNKGHEQDRDHEQSMNHTPDMNMIAVSADDPDILSHNSTWDSNLPPSNRKGQKTDVISSIETDSSVNYSSSPETAGLKRDRRNGRASPDDLEFQDLIDSMAMPPVATPAPSTPAPSTPAPSTPASSTPAHSTPAPSTPAPSTPALSTLASSPIWKRASPQNEQPLPSLSQSVFPEQKSSVSSKAEAPDVHSNFLEKNGSVVTPFVPSKSFVDDVDIRTAGTANLSSTVTSQNVSVSNNISRDNNTHTSSSHLQNYHTQTPDNDTPALGPKPSTQKPVLNGSLPTLSASSPQLQRTQWKSVTQAYDSQPLTGLSKSKSASTTRQASAFAYSDVAFTCLENLKYDCLLSSAKGTDESKQEEKKLRAKFELIKSKLQNGGKRTWEVYKACVQREHASIIQQIEDLCLLQQWSEVQLLSEKKTIAERELTILAERLPELKY